MAIEYPAQGMGLHLFREQVTPESVHGAVMRLLSEDSFREAAQRVSRRLRSRKRTALQETAGKDRASVPDPPIKLKDSLHACMHA